ncbi:MAG: GNAT family N-acetyltransferase [Clostridia bacterium]
MLRLVDVDRYNFSSLIDLSVGKEQDTFIASNAYSLAQAKVQPECVPFGIYEGNVPIGFCMYCLDLDDHEYWIYRLMIDKRHQGKGCGREALWLLIKLLQADSEHHVIFLSVEPNNKWAIQLYESMGFVPDGRMMYGEIVYKLKY